MIPRFLPALAVKPGFGTIPAQLVGQRGPRSPGLQPPPGLGPAQGLSRSSLLTLKGGFTSSPRSEVPLLCSEPPFHFCLLPCRYLPYAKCLPFSAPPASPVWLGPAEAGRGSFPSGKNNLPGAAFHGESPQPAGGGDAPPALRCLPGRSAGAAAAGQVARQPPAGAAPCRRAPPPLQSRVPSQPNSSPSVSPAGFSLGVFVSSDIGLPVFPCCSRVWQREVTRPRAEVRLPHLRRPAAGAGCGGGTPSGLGTAPCAPPCLPPRLSATPMLPGWRFCEVKRSRWKRFGVEVEAGCSSLLRWRGPWPFVLDSRGVWSSIAVRAWPGLT